MPLSPPGSLQLMPTSDGMTYRFNYVNGHPKNERQLTLFDSVGVKATTLYTSLDLLADPEEPRDLYGMLLRAAA